MMARRKTYRLRLKNVGPIKEADVTFGDLTVIVGPQATGKSVFLQALKLLLDQNHIQDTFSKNSVVFNDESDAFLGGFFGKGMSDAWHPKTSSLTWHGKEYALPGLAKATKSPGRDERLFYIPAQRVMSLANGVTQNFGQFNYGDPYVLRYFSDAVHNLVQNEFGAKAQLFPQQNRLNQTLRDPIEQHLFGGGTLEVDAKDFTKRLVLKVNGHREGLPFTAWSAGQREFAPLLLGLYWLCPAGKNSRRESIEWVVIEEPEMGLHPQGIEAVLLLVLELIRRGYRVVISSHSPVVLDLVWAIQEFKKLKGTEADIRKLLALGTGDYAKRLAESVINKDFRVFFFNRQKITQDISRLDPSSSSLDEAEWGGLVGFASRTNEVISDLVNREALPKARKRKSKIAGFQE